jgi:hypothetical protein
VDNYEKLTEHGSWRGLSAKLCHGSQEARDTMKAIFLETTALGVPLVSFDQEIGGAQMAPCYSTTHGHPPGYGNWMWADFRDLCAEILEEGKPIQPELGLFLENVSELAIPYMATYWSRQFGEVDVGVTGGRGVGLFSYLYHEYVTAIGAACVQGQGQRGTRPSAGLRCMVLANNLVRGLIPGPFMHHVPLETEEEWEKLVSGAYFSYCRPYKHFPEYLLLGKTVRPLPVECDTTEVTFWRRDVKNGTPRRKGGPPLAEVELKVPAVAVGSFEAADGSVATFLANVTPEVQAATVRVAEGKGPAVFSSDRSDLSDGSDKSDKAKYSPDLLLTLSLDPFEVRVVVTREHASELTGGGA